MGLPGEALPRQAEATFAPSLGWGGGENTTMQKKQKIYCEDDRELKLSQAELSLIVTAAPCLRSP